MNEITRYVKIVEWSDEDQCFVGSCLGLFYGGCHGSDEKKVFAELCEIVEETMVVPQKSRLNTTASFQQGCWNPVTGMCTIRSFWISASLPK